MPESLPRHRGRHPSRAPSQRAAVRTEAQNPGRARYAWAVARIGLGSVFLWAFLDKLLGLGFGTAPRDAWVNGGSPTLGFLTGATRGPFAETFRAMAGQPWVDPLFMAGLLLVGGALLIGVAVHVAAYAGAAMLLLMYLATFPPTTNPVLDDHIIYAIVLIGLAWARAGRTWGLGRQWTRLRLVRRHPILE